MQKKCVFDQVFKIEFFRGLSLVRNYRAYNTGQVEGWKAYLELFLSTAERFFLTMQGKILKILKSRLKIRRIWFNLNKSGYDA